MLEVLVFFAVVALVGLVFVIVLPKLTRSSNVRETDED
ncbi:hypothetical protein DFP95_10785 [Cohnella lupini]|uniref:Uncharacterized protein n=1 Tax=Cohnella lupini TaxID=1294267 RepID=A0A3D9IDF0_9BACL|nr:hypothetical protein DFP95_10785 [Cohnella lupini]